MSPPPAPGQVLDGRFRLSSELGRGGMSILYRGEDLEHDGQPVVVKVPLPMFSSGLGGWSMYQQEEDIGRRLDHPFVLRYLPLPPARRRSYVVTEFVPGRSLADVLAERQRVAEPEALAIAIKLCAAVEHLHERGVVHYDVKPGNIMLCPDGSIRLIDFGLAHGARDARFTISRALPALASAGYAAPEQLRRKPGRRAVDIYAIGAVLYEMVTGRPPFLEDGMSDVGILPLVGDPRPPRSLNLGLSLETEEIILRALRRNPAERYTSAAQMKASLEDPQRVPVTGLRERLRPATPWRRALYRARYVALVALLPVVTQVALFTFLWRHFAHR